MRILDSLVCLGHRHVFINITYAGSPYEYCLRCGKVKVQDATFGDIASLPKLAVSSADKLEHRILRNG
jgi:hypothetical protein